MRTPVRVRSAFRVASASLSPASEGQKLFAQLGCTACHRDDSLRRAPVLEGLYGRPVQMTDGTVIVADDTYLRESILNPAALIVLGFQPIMPPYAGRVSEEQMLQLLAYIRSIGDRPGRERTSRR